ncbi:MAG: cobalt-precorrin-6A reductase [Kiloniellales bacterium]|nr:cobalt-precorrin-6A reductase [Kiloniellales bacterium]
MADRKRLLILGGTEEGWALADWAARQERLCVTTSLAGRTREPKRPPGQVVSGGFGGAEGLTAFLREQATDLLVDATHPFAATMAGHAAAASAAAGVPRLKLLRAPWQAEDGDRWITVPDTAAAARALEALGERVFLSSGRQGIEAFAPCRDHWFLVRLIDPPSTPLPLARHEIVLARGPFDADEEVALLQQHRIDALVSKNSGGGATYGKILAARRLGLPVVMIARPPAPPGDSVASVEAAAEWIAARLEQIRV